MSAYWLYFSDEEILEAIAEGEPGAREELSKRYADRLYDFCVRLTDDPPRAARTAAGVVRHHLRTGADALDRPLRISFFSLAYARCGADAKEPAARELVRYGLSPDEIASIVGAGALSVQRWLSGADPRGGLSALTPAPAEVVNAFFERTPTATLATAFGPRRRSRVALVAAAATLAIFSAFGIARAFETGGGQGAQRPVQVGDLTATTIGPDGRPTTATRHPAADLVVSTTTTTPPRTGPAGSGESGDRDGSPAGSEDRGASPDDAGPGVTAGTSAPPGPGTTATTPPNTPGSSGTTTPPTDPTTTTATTTTTTTTTTLAVPPPAPFTAAPSELVLAARQRATVTVVRTGGTPGVPVPVTVLVTGRDDEWFDIVEGSGTTCTGAWLDVGGSCTVEVRAASWWTLDERTAELRVEASPAELLEIPLRRV